MNEREIKEKIEELVRDYYQKTHRKNEDNDPFEKIQYSGRVYDEKEMVNLVAVSYTHLTLPTSLIV